jgi:O-antigen/teichoic acid export membrane protein
MVILPYLSIYKKKYTVQIFESIFIITSSVLFYILVFIAIDLYFLSNTIFGILFTKEFYDAIAIYNVLLAGLPFVGLNLALYNYFVLINRNDINMKATFFGLLCNIGLNFILINYFGVIGAAYASVLSYVIIIFFLYSLVFFKSKNTFYIIFPFKKEIEIVKTIKLFKKDL